MIVRTVLSHRNPQYDIRVTVFPFSPPFILYPNRADKRVVRETRRETSLTPRIIKLCTRFVIVSYIISRASGYFIIDTAATVPG